MWQLLTYWPNSSWFEAHSTLQILYLTHFLSEINNTHLLTKMPCLINPFQIVITPSNSSLNSQFGGLNNTHLYIPCFIIWFTPCMYVNIKNQTLGFLPLAYDNLIIWKYTHTHTNIHFNPHEGLSKWKIYTILLMFLEENLENVFFSF
jgi:hypothetical protein